MDGLEATSVIRQEEHESGRHIPIIAMTASAMTGDRERCLEAGMDSYISKPVDAKQLYELLDRFARVNADESNHNLNPHTDLERPAK